MSRPFAVIAGGGTAGHVTPALAIAEALVADGVDRSEILFVGSRRGIERRLIPPAGYELVELAGEGIERKPSLKAAKAVLSLIVGTVSGVGLIWRRRPSVVVSVGGFAAVPAIVGAIVARIPIVIAEQNAVPSLANRLAGRFARAAAVPFEGSELPRAVVTGNPIRPEIAALADRTDADVANERSAARRRLDLDPDATVVAVMGGSLGARAINGAVTGALEALADRADLAIIHLTGPTLHDEVVAAAGDIDGPLTYRAIPFLDDMADLYRAADLAVCRAGASTVSELAAAGLPAVLVPLPIAPNDAQGANAKVIEAAGGAVLVRDHEMTSERFVALVDELADPADLARRRDALATVAKPQAAAHVAGLVSRAGGRTVEGSAP